MDKTERILQIALATMASLATLLLGMGQGNSLLPVLTMVAAAASLYVTDFRGWFHLPRWMANVVSLTAVAFTYFDYRRQDEDFQLLAIANLLIYLQFVLFFQHKSQRTYWQLGLLGLLQVVVASALNLGMGYGLLLAVYGLIGVATFALFYLRREAIAHGALALEGAVIPHRPVAQGSKSKGHRRTHVAAARISPVAVNRNWITQVLVVFAVSLACTIGVFFFFPRFQRQEWEGAASDDATTGFPESVTLDDITSVLESPEVVMHVKFFEAENENPITVRGEPYFRGKVLTNYSNGRWSRNDDNGYRLLAQPISPVESIRQRISLLPQKSPNLFSVSPAYIVPSDRPTDVDILWNPITQSLIREQSIRRTQRRWGQIEYTLVTPALYSGVQSELLPVFTAHLTGNPRISVRSLRNEIRACTAFPSNARFDPIEETGNQILADASLSADDPYRAAKQLERYFHDPGRFQYSLHIDSKAPSQRDPVEYFLTTRRTGHCEYFAGALTLLLRSQGIPARIALGYRSAEYNSIGRFYRVRQLHAHAWVEAFLTPDQLPEGHGFPSDEELEGAWLRLDPTPLAGEVEDQLVQIGMLTKLREFRDYCQLLWNDYVLGLNSERQQETIYEPFKANVRALFSRESWTYFFQDFRGRLDGGVVAWLRSDWFSRWFSWQAGMLVLIVGVMLVLLYRLVLRPIFRLAYIQLKKRRIRRANWARRVEFYQRFERLLKRHGFRRSRTQTQAEFATQVENDLGPAIPDAVLPKIASTFYRVRFGEQALNSAERHAVEHSLNELERTLARNHPRRKAT